MDMREKFLSIFFKRSRLLIIALFVIGFIFCIIPLQRFQENLLKVNSIEDARLYSRAISHFRTIYTREVVLKAQKHGMKITHDYKKDAHAIPLPAAFSMLLGEEIAKDRYGGKVSLYSPYPFSWRKNTGGLTDDFKKAAWSAFLKDPQTDYFRFENENGATYLRYAVPDVMRESCVQCHNTHPQSPKVGWKVGDVRGILEVKRPVTQVNEKATTLFYERMLQLFGFLIIFLIFLYFLLTSLRKKIALLDAQAVLIQNQQQQLVQNSKMSALGEMAGGIAHEINNPLAAINMTVRTMKKQLQKENTDKNSMLQCMNDVEATVARIHKIVMGLRTISRNDPNEKLDSVLLQSIFDDVLSLCAEKIKNSGIELTIDDSEGVLNKLVQCSRIPLSQVIINLIQNAHDAIEEARSDQAKWIKIKLHLNQKLLVVKVIDSGAGIDKAIVDKIFQPFFTTKDIGKGTGIGLSLSKSIIEKQSGRLYYDHTSAKTCFVIEIPQNLS